MKKVVFIYNPYSGENRILSHLDYILRQYQDYGYRVVPFRFTEESGLEEAFADVDDDYHHVLVAGGDGTINSVVNEMQKQGVKLPLAILPAGTANDFATLLGYSGNIQTACREILEGRVSSVDLGLVNDRYFVNVLSAGLFTEVSQKTPTILKNTFGKMAYYMSGIQELPRFRKIHVRIDSDDLFFDDNVYIFFVFNGNTAGNMRFAHNSDIQDGLFDVVIVKGEAPLITLSSLFNVLSGLRRDYPSGIIHFKTRELRIDSEDNVNIDIDGEHGPAIPIRVRCIPDGLDVIVP